MITKKERERKYMARMIPDSKYEINGLRINVKKIPFGTRWRKNCCGFKEGDLYKADRLMTNGSGIIKGITIHNTGSNADAETYTRATFNQNMNSARVHFYVDKKEVWQTLEENEVGWHAGTGDRSVGNDSYIAIEIIMGPDGTEDDKKAEENGALLTAHLMIKHDLRTEDIVTHRHWSGKYCPAYILPHWDRFLELVKEKCVLLLNDKYDEDITFNTDTKTENKQEETAIKTDASMSRADNKADDYALYPVYKAVQNKILQGTPEGDLRLHDYVTRQDLCVILERLSLLPEVSEKIV